MIVKDLSQRDFFIGIEPVEVFKVKAKKHYGRIGARKKVR